MFGPFAAQGVQEEEPHAGRRTGCRAGEHDGGAERTELAPGPGRELGIEVRADDGIGDASATCQ